MVLQVLLLFGPARAGKLLAEELRPKGVCVALLHPGFNRTDMTKKFQHIWDKEGAVPSAEGASISGASPSLFTRNPFVDARF